MAKSKYLVWEEDEGGETREDARTVEAHHCEEAAEEEAQRRRETCDGFPRGGVELHVESESGEVYVIRVTQEVEPRYYSRIVRQSSAGRHDFSDEPPWAGTEEEAGG